MFNESIKYGIIQMFEKNFEVKPGESILILADFPTERELLNLSRESINNMIERVFLARYIYTIGSELNYKIFLKLYPATGQSGSEVPKEVADLMSKYDIFIAITTYSLTHTSARLNATDVHGARGASCPGITPDMFDKNGAMQIDHESMISFTNKLAEHIRNASNGKIISPNGTIIQFKIPKNNIRTDTGIIKNPGDFSNLPAGEVYFPPIKGTTNGKLIVSKGWFKDLDSDMILIIKDGLVQEIQNGGKIGQKFRTLLFDKNIDENVRLSRRNIAEIGIGTNPNAKNPLNLLEAEKIKGTCHLAIGDNHTFGGTVEADIHIDFVIPDTKLLLDDTEFLLY
ncbi:MAG: aminopeptidase [Candidatus Helarchaeota archaeon]